MQCCCSTEFPLTLKTELKFLTRRLMSMWSNFYWNSSRMRNRNCLETADLLFASYSHSKHGLWCLFLVFSCDILWTKKDVFQVVIRLLTFWDWNDSFPEIYTLRCESRKFRLQLTIYDRTYEIGLPLEWMKFHRYFHFRFPSLSTQTY